MTYVSDQTSAELRAHMRSLTSTPGWREPLADRLWKEIQALDAQVKQLTNERDGEREARERTSDALRQKDAAVSALMSVCTQEQIERAKGGPLS